MKGRHIDFLRKFQVTQYEMVFYFVLVGIFTIGIGYVDGIIFDTYVRVGMIDGVGSEYGDSYQSIMFGIILWVALGFAVVRIVMGILAGARFTPILLFTGGLWFLSMLIFHNTGFTDYFYYKTRIITGLGDPSIPLNMDWLNEMGLFQWVRFATGNDNVNPMDLYIGMAIGISVLLVMWFVAIHHYKKGTLKILE